MPAANDPASADRPIVLTTDFGLADPYAGVMKGVILGINPRAAVVDLTHHIQPQNLLQAAFVLGASYRFFPRGSIHAVVVDPGVGTSRKALLLVTPQGSFLAPDNGVLSCVLRDFLQPTLDRAPDKAATLALPNGLEAYSLNNPCYWLEPVSRTFHGRDVFAPVAAHLSLGVAPEELGEQVSEVVWLPTPQAVYREDTIDGEVILVDHSGNLVTNVPSVSLVGIGEVEISIKSHRISGLSRTFNQDGAFEGRELAALVGSNGSLEIAVPNGSAALALEAGVGEPVRVVLLRYRR